MATTTAIVKRETPALPVEATRKKRRTTEEQEEHAKKLVRLAEQAQQKWLAARDSFAERAYNAGKALRVLQKRIKKENRGWKKYLQETWKDPGPQVAWKYLRFVKKYPTLEAARGVALHLTSMNKFEQEERKPRGPKAGKATPQADKDRADLRERFGKQLAEMADEDVTILAKCWDHEIIPMINNHIFKRAATAKAANK